MRIHVTAAVYVLFFASLGVSRGEFAALLAVAVVITAEGFNTAIEMLCDYAQKSYNRFIGRTKDIAAGAVLISAVFAAFVGIAVLWRPKALWALRCRSSPRRSIARFFSLCPRWRSCSSFLAPRASQGSLSEKKEIAPCFQKAARRETVKGAIYGNTKLYE